MIRVPEGKTWSLRPAAPADKKAVLSLLRSASLPKEGIEDRFPAGYLVVEACGDVIAAAGLERYGDFGLLRSLAVAPAWRGRGIGRALTASLLQLARAMPLQAVYLLTTTAEAYLAREGFARIERDDVPAGIRASVEFASACPANAVCMFKKPV